MDAQKQRPTGNASGPRFEVWVSRDAMPASLVVVTMDASGAIDPTQFRVYERLS